MGHPVYWEEDEGLQEVVEVVGVAEVGAGFFDDLGDGGRVELAGFFEDGRRGGCGGAARRGRGALRAEHRRGRRRDWR